MSQRNGRKTATKTSDKPEPSSDLALPTITRAQANDLIKKRAVELYQNAKSEQQESIRQFESEFGRADRIDGSLLKELQHLQMRFAGIGARQQRAGYNQEPKVNKFVKALGEIIGEVTIHLATDRALELFGQIDERDYVGYSGAVGRKGYDETVLANYRIIDDPKPVTDSAAIVDNDVETVCLHAEIQPFEEDPLVGACSDCGKEFDLSSHVETTTDCEPAA